MEEGRAEVARSAFAAGTLLLTERGEVAVETLVPGDVVISPSGARQPVRAIREGRAADGKAVLVPANAIGTGKPKRDTTVTADHFICLKVVSECLVPVGWLTYKSVCYDIDAAELSFWEVELAEAGIVYAEGLEMQSGLGDDAELPERIEDRRLIEMIRAILRGRAASIGWHLNGAPGLDLHILADGERIDPANDGLSYRFVMPSTASDVWLVSECSVPKEVGFNADGRLLGACLSEIRIEDGLLVSRTIGLDDPRLSEGFQGFEGVLRWTDGCAQLPASLWHDCRDVFFLSVRLAQDALPRYCKPERP